MEQRQAAPSTIPHLIHYRVLLEPIGTNVFFLAPWGRRVMGTYRALGVDAGGAVYDLDNQHAVNVYEADSDIAKPSAGDLRSAGDYPAAICYGRYLQLPPTLDATHSAAGESGCRFGYQ